MKHARRERVPASSSAKAVRRNHEERPKKHGFDGSKSQKRPGCPGSRCAWFSERGDAGICCAWASSLRAKPPAHHTHPTSEGERRRRRRHCSPSAQASARSSGAAKGAPEAPAATAPRQARLRNSLTATASTPPPGALEFSSSSGGSSIMPYLAGALRPKHKPQGARSRSHPTQRKARVASVLNHAEKRAQTYNSATSRVEAGP